jgi:type IV secretion system protein TrbL
MDVIDTFLATFIAYIDSGFGLLQGDVAYLSATLIAIDITLAGLFWALSPNSDVIAGLLKKVLYVGFFAWIIGNFAGLSAIVFESFAALGLTASGTSLTAADLLRPGFIASVGFEASQPLLDEISLMLGPIAFFENFIMIAVMFIAWAVILVAFFVLAVQLFITILEFKLTTLAGFVLVPFALWNKSAFLAERVLGNVITSGVKLMVLAVIIGIGATLFESVTLAFRTGEDITLAQVMGTVLASITFFWMGIFAPGIASGLITGAPQLGAGSAAGAALGVAAGTLGSALAARAAGGAVIAGVSGAVRAGASMAGGARTAYDMGSVASGKTGAGGAFAGLAGVAQAAGDTARRAFTGSARSIDEAYRRGASSAFEATGGSPRPNAHETQSSASRAPSGHFIGSAAQTAAHTLRDGDRGSSGAAPSLTQDKDD